MLPAGQEAPLDTGAARPASTLTNVPVRESNPPRIYIDDVYVRDAARGALQDASQRLKMPKCRAVLNEFVDARGRPLTEKLAALDVDVPSYLQLLIFMNGERHRQCRRDGILAFTIPGSRIIYVCGRNFERSWRRDSPEIRGTIIHEVLHSLGLGEDPPSPRDITYRIQQLCW